MMRENKLRRILREGKTSVATRLWSTWPLYTESLGATGNFDYMEFVAEYAPFTQADLENMARAAELYEMGSMIKVDFQNRFWRRRQLLPAFRLSTSPITGRRRRCGTPSIPSVRWWRGQTAGTAAPTAGS